jgi:hypothetical protein
MSKATILLLAGLVLLLASISAAEAAVPQLITIQGRLRNATTLEPLVGNYDVNFTIWDDATAGNMLYNETQSIIPDQFGIFQILLGSINILNLPFNQQYYLQLSVNGSILSPRHSMTSSAYTYRSGVSNDLQCTNCVNTSKIADDAVTLEKYNCVNVTCSNIGFPNALAFNLSGICNDTDGCTLRLSFHPTAMVGSWQAGAWGYLAVDGSDWASMVLQGGSGAVSTFTGDFTNGTSEILIKDSGANCVMYDRGGIFATPYVTCPSGMFNPSCSYWACD